MARERAQRQPGGAQLGMVHLLAQRIADQQAFGLAYARTLVCWRDAFEAKLAQVRAQGFDERFVRMWRFYLCYCEAGFRAGSTDVYHYVLTHADR